MQDNKMNPAVKAKWLKALRSGKYKKTKGSLCVPGKGFCCLGVLTDLYIKETKAGQWNENGHNKKFTGAKTVSGESMLLPREVREWAGLEDENPEVISNKATGSETELADLNDHYGYSFKRLATAIERSL